MGKRAQPSAVLPGSSNEGPREDEAQEAHKSVGGTGQLVPMTDVADMVADMVGRVPTGKLEEALKAFGRVIFTFATMCSGTEAPIVAMEEIKRAVRDRWGVVLRYKHLFSVEIDSHKQAYIERNFNPDILFTDVRDVATKEEAPTAYGGLRAVPGGVSIVVAGFACVDFSTLNPKRKDVQDAGESGDTLRAILNYAARFRPRAMILENVGAADWVMIQVCTNNNFHSTEPKGKLSGVAKRHLEEIWGNREASSGYSTCVVKVDTKAYYLPQTRKRSYMVCIDRKTIGIKAADKLAQRWAERFRQLERNASSPMDDFLLPTDDRRVRMARDAGGMDEFGDRKRRTESTWVKCKVRYANYRDAISCGSGRPLTRWTESGACHPPEHWWKNWAHYQSDRLREHWDISHLRSAQRGYDSQYKTRVWELSQNIDRSTDTSPWGIAQCITPTAQPLITSRGGLAIPTESLILQGLPADRLDLGRLTHAQVQDLAGNAMSTTVVAAAMLALLVTVPTFLTDFLPQHEPSSDLGDEVKHIIMDSSNVSDYQELNLAATAPKTVQDLTCSAQLSGRMCGCESSKINTDARIYRCKHCNHTCCARCITENIHEYDKIDGQERKSPASFERLLKDALPMRLRMTGDLHIQQPHRHTKTAEDLKDLAIITQALESLHQQEFRFVEVLRTYCWTVAFEARSFSLKLKIHNGQAVWLMFLKPGKEATGDDPIRRIARNPIARMIPDPGSRDLCAGYWEVSVPSTHTFNIQVDTEDYQTGPSWRAQLGLPEYEDEEYYLKLDISTFPAQSGNRPQVDQLTGTYELLPKCETAEASLYKKTATEPDGSQIYFFLDPSLHISESFDRYVFATTHERLKWGEVREIMATMENRWHASEPAGLFPCIALGRWIDCKWQLEDCSNTRPVGFCTMIDYSHVVIPDGYVRPKAINKDPVTGKELTAEERRRQFKLPDGVVDCNTLHKLLASVLVPLDTLEAWNAGAISPAKQRLLPRQFAWAYDRLSLHSHLPPHAVQLLVPSSPGTCETCAPSLPIVRFARSPSGKKFTPYEDEIQAIDYERAFKARAPIVVATVNDHLDGQHGRVDIAVNWVSLVHRAMAKLPYQAGDDVALECRIETIAQDTSTSKLPPFTLSHCKNNPPFTFVFPSDEDLRLRPEQARAFQRMLDQEDANILPPFAEEAREEALLPEHELRVHALFSKKGIFSGGVLAHEVGFGKTALILALIDHSITRMQNAPSPPDLPNIKGKIASKATLVVVPSTIVKQWKSQADLFLGQRNYTVLAIGDVARLAFLTVGEIQEADIVIMSSRVFESTTYKDGIAVLGCFPPQHNTNTRLFQAWYDRAAEGMTETVERIKANGLGGLAAELEARFVTAFTARDLVKPTHSTRLKGKEYAEDAKKKEKQAKKKKQEEEGSGAEEENEGEDEDDAGDGEGDDDEVEEDNDDDGDDDDDDGEGEQPGKGESKTKEKKKRTTKKPLMVDEPIAPKMPVEEVVEMSPQERARQGRKEAYTLRNRFKLPGDKPPEDDDDDVPPGDAPADDAPAGDAPAGDAPAPGDASKTATEETSKKATKKPTKEKKEKKEVKKEPNKEPKTPAKQTTKKEPPSRSELLTDMKNPILQMFHFRRVVVDEVTYVDDNAHTLIADMEAPHRWVISGTPKLGDFMDIKGLAAFIKFELGEDDDTPGIMKAYNVRKLRKQRTNAEIFRSLAENRSMEFHLARHLYAQQWLDRFARQDQPEIGEIKVHNHYLGIQLTSTERAIELEIYQLIDATGVATKTPRGPASKLPDDRVDRIRTIVKGCENPIELLLVVNSFYQWPKFLEHPDPHRVQNPVNPGAVTSPTEALLRRRRKEFGGFFVPVAFHLEKAVWLRDRASKAFPELEYLSPLTLWLEEIRDVEQAPLPREIVETITSIVAACQPSEDDPRFLDQSPEPPRDNMTKADIAKYLSHLAIFDPNGDLTVHKTKAYDFYRLHEQLVDVLDQCLQIVMEMASRTRGIRFMGTVQRCQARMADPTISIECSQCDRPCSDMHITKVAGPCGHIFCRDCFAAIPHNAGLCTIQGCNGAMVQNSRYTVALLGADDNNPASQRYGAKVGRITNLILNEIPEDDQVLLFLQQDQLMQPLSEAFEKSGVSNIALYDSNKTKHGKLMEEFQNTTGTEAKRMLILDATKDTAAGANLTNANHVIFLGPFWADTHHLYHQSMTQCIGRARRYGQTKEVHVYRLIALNTVDVDVLEWREGKKLVELVDGSFDLKVDEDLTDEERAAEHFETGFVRKQGFLDRPE
ncbi:MAG: hypothetical protein Q9208_000624 [Pyrenodesmia sp. 3 TL-2023]